ncbi:MAG TPA: type II toxin-antitoxin system RelE/ParE family toxin [Chloroflexota bacterium]|nr:type II toxin-antitoxin system RelE/ParE family toxin [Chloroflexota bacterium]
MAIKSDSTGIADRLTDSITRRFLMLAKHPYSGRRRDVDLRPGLRSFPVGAYIVIYRIEGDDVLILRILRGSRAIQALFDP